MKIEFSIQWLQISQTADIITSVMSTVQFMFRQFRMFDTFKI